MCLNQPVPTRVTQFPSQQPNKGIDCVDLYLAPVSPNRFHNRPSRHNASLITDEQLQQAELGKRQPELHSVTERPKRVDFEEQVSALQDVLCLGRAAACQRTYPGQQFLKREGFGEVVVRSGIKPPDHVRDGVARCQHKYTDIFLSAAQLSCYLESAHAGKHYVQKNNVKGPGAGYFERRSTIARYLDFVCLFAQALRQQLRHLGVVFNDQDMHGSPPKSLFLER